MTDAPIPAPNSGPVPGAVGLRYAEEAKRKGLTIDQLFLLQTRNAIQFVAWVIGILLIVGAIIGIISAVNLIHLVNAVNGSGGGGGGGY